MSSIKKIKEEISSFIQSQDILLVIPYTGHELNPRHYWHKIATKDFFSFLFHTAIIIFSTGLPASRFKNFLLRRIGMKIGKDAFISAGVLFDLEFPKLINIKEGAIIGTGTKILTHEVTIKHIRIGRITIGKQSIVGAGSLIRSGVSIGDGAVVAMGSLVLKDVPSKNMVGGVPARKIKKINKLV